MPPNQEVLGPGGSGSRLNLCLVDEWKTRKMSAQDPRAKTVSSVELDMLTTVWKQEVCLSVDVYNVREKRALRSMPEVIFRLRIASGS